VTTTSPSLQKEKTTKAPGHWNIDRLCDSVCGGTSTVLIDCCAPPHHTDSRIGAMHSADPRPIPGRTDDAAHHHHHAIGRWVSGAGQVVSSWTAKKYALPDKTVASQILMYRQLLHTTCRPGLVLSRKYEATPAQVSVQHMPWWETVAVVDEADPTKIVKILTMVDTGKMVISYDNLITRLWNTALERHGVESEAADTNHTSVREVHRDSTEFGLLDPPSSSIQSSVLPPSSSSSIALSKDRTKLPPIPHEYWVSNLGFQQTDPVTDFRSGGILSLALMVWIVEHCPNTYRRFCVDDPAAVLPFGITSINVTDMIAKLLMLSKRTDRMDALLSQKPFWKMFSDPYAILTVQELALELLADVVDELVQVRRTTAELQKNLCSPSTAAVKASSYVTVFDFTHILTVTEQRVEYDLLGAGPISIPDLRQIHGKLRAQYQKQLRQKLDRLAQQQRPSNNATNAANANSMEDGSAVPVMKGPEHLPTKSSVMQEAPRHNLLGSVVASTNGFLSKSNPIWNPFQKQKDAPRAAALKLATTDAAPALLAAATDIETESVLSGTPTLPPRMVDLLDSDATAVPPSLWWGAPLPADLPLPERAACPSSDFQISDDDIIL
jgi:ELMO/CED-12 family